MPIEVEHFPLGRSRLCLRSGIFSLTVWWCKTCSRRQIRLTSPHGLRFRYLTDVTIRSF